MPPEHVHIVRLHPFSSTTSYCNINSAVAGTQYLESFAPVFHRPCCQCIPSCEG
jgi:hypothetical protein